MAALRPRRQSLGVVVTLVVVAVSSGVVSRHAVQGEQSRMLRERAGEVGLMLGGVVAETHTSLQSLLGTARHDSSPGTFAEVAKPLLTNQARAVVLAVDAGAGYRVAEVISYGDGPAIDQLISGQRAAVLGRAAAAHDLVAGIVGDGPQSRLLVALGAPPGDPNRVVYQENAIDPFVPVPATSAAPFAELEVSLYASSNPDPGALLMASSHDFPRSGPVATGVLHVGPDDWLLLVRPRRSLVGSFALRAPWILLGVGLLSALLAGVVVEVLARRRDYALRLVAARTADLSDSLDHLETTRAALEQQVFTDSLTGLPNRAHFHDRLTMAVSARGSRAGPAVLFLDLDRFKWVNDSLGHRAGDSLLLAVAERLRAAIRADDMVARFGGDEFVVLCDTFQDVRDVLDLAARLAHSLAGPFHLHSREIRLTASIGVAFATSGSAEAVLRDADTAMYRAKDLGRDRVEVFDDGMRSSAIARLDTESALARALDSGELRVHYQPVVDVGSGRVMGVEALVRWNHPVRGLLTPVDFIGIAEDTGLIVPIGAFVLTEACTQVAAWNRSHPERAPLTLGVNLSPRQLDAPTAAQLVADALDSSGLAPGLLSLEITESALMKDVEASRTALLSMKELGVHLAVDDFGTGYASLLYVRRLPVDVLKVDQSFVAGLAQNPADSAIVAGVIGLAHALGMTAIAEGVETERQHQELMELGCDLAQGWWWSSALPAPEFGRWLRGADTTSLAQGMADLAGLVD